MTKWHLPDIVGDENTVTNDVLPLGFCVMNLLLIQTSKHLSTVHLFLYEQRISTRTENFIILSDFQCSDSL